MRFLFSTILSIIFLTYPLFCNSYDNVTLYKWKTSYGVQWKKKGDIDVQDLYEGEVENGEPNGLGIIIYVDGSQYFGEWKDGKEDGEGTYNYPNGIQYVGEFKDGRFNGKGRMTTITGTIIGEFKDGYPWNNLMFDNNGNIKSVIGNGRTLETEQEIKEYLKNRKKK